MTSLRSIARNLAYAHVGGTALVLIYHRVAELDRDPQLLAVSPANFEVQMEALAQAHRVVSLEELADGLRHHKVPDRSVAITFDDGYADNLLAAEPILRAHGVPATVFVSSGYARSQREFWWDELELLVLCPGTLAEHIEIATPGGGFSATVAGAPAYSEDDADRDAGWNVLSADTSPRHGLYRQLAAFLRPLSAPDREASLAQLRALAHATDATHAAPVVPADADPAARTTHRPLTASEVGELDASPVVAVGAHTVNHPVLSARDLDEQRREILEDRDTLSAWCGRPMSAFSYPYGGLDDYTDGTVALVREAGFTSACSNHLGVVKPWVDPFRLPRMVVRDWDVQTFSEKIEGWFGGSR